MLRCEHDNETLGLTVLDEPAGLQSDPTILDLQVGFWSDFFLICSVTGFIFSQFQLRSVSKKTSRAGSRVKRVKDTAAQAKVFLKQKK